AFAAHQQASRCGRAEWLKGVRVRLRIDASTNASETTRVLASNARLTPVLAEPLLPMAEVDMRTSIRPTIAEVDLGAIRRNFVSLQKVVGQGVGVWGVIKADAYGHGAVAVA